MSRLLYIEPVAHTLFSRHFTQLCERLAPAGLAVDVVHLPGDAASPFLSSIELVRKPLLSTIGDAAVDGYDGVVVGCASDPCVLAGRETSSIPVVGPFGASLHLAAIRRQRIGVVTPGPDSELDFLRALSDEYGLADRVVGVRIADVGHPEPGRALEERMRTSPDAVRDEILAMHAASVLNRGAAVRAAEELIEEDGAEVLVLACTFWAGTISPLRAALPVAVVDPLEAVLAVGAALCEADTATVPS